jgi:predicted component of type VI protein secretion system
MTSVTIRVLEGMEQGRVYSRLKLPVTIGREEENSVQLNDDHISRFHAKIQDHSGRVILTDLGSTNGTKVNGHWIQVRILQIGDVISVGRCVLLLSECQSDKIAVTPEEGDPFRTAYVKGGATVEDDSKHLDFVDPLPGSAQEPSALFPNGRPELPSKLSSLQQVQMSDLLSYLHERVGVVIKQAVENDESENGRVVQIEWEAWSKQIALMSDLSEYIKSLHSPE